MDMVEQIIKGGFWHRTEYHAGPAETVGQVGHLPYHFLVVNTGNDVLWLLSEIVK